MGLVVVGALVGQQQVVAVDGGGHGGLVAAGLHELQDGHLGGGVLHGHAVGAQGQGGLAALQFLVLRDRPDGRRDLLGQGQRAAQALAHDLQVAAATSA